jgi:hypothetical protein
MFLLPDAIVKASCPVPTTHAQPTDDLARALVASMQREVEDIQPLVTPIWLGCKIGQCVSVLRDQHGGLLMVWGPSAEASQVGVANVGVGQLFSADSPWIDEWIKAIAIREISSVDPTSDDFSVALRRASSLFRRSAAARRASRQVLDALDLEPEVTALALHIDPFAKGDVSRISFRVMQNVLLHRDDLRRLAREQPHWVSLAAIWLGEQVLLPKRDLMAQIKGLARSHGVSRDAWRMLAALGGRLLDDLPSSFQSSEEDLPFAAARSMVLFAAAKAKHWIGPAWATLNSDFRATLVRAVQRRSTLAALEPLLRAIGHEATHVQNDFDGPVALENEFSGLIGTLDFYQSYEADFAFEHEMTLAGLLEELDTMPMPPTSTRIRAWRNWKRRAMNHVSTPFWSPISCVDGDRYLAYAIATRAELIEHGQCMAHCVASYANRCAMGTYVVYDIQDHVGASVATLGLKIERSSSVPGEFQAVGASIDELSGYKNSGVSRRVRHFANHVLSEVRRLLSQTPRPLGATKSASLGHDDVA